MLQNRQRISLLCWGLAGVPIIASFIQALIALFGLSGNDIPVIGRIKQVLTSAVVFDAAATIFRNSSTIVLTLFVLIAAAWLAQGLGLLVLKNREFTLGATGFVTLFFALFVLVYLPLLSSGVSPLEVGGFFLIPVLAASLSWVSTLSHNWDVTLREETAAKLSTAESAAQQALSEFQNTIERAVDTKTLNTLESIAPDGVDSFRQSADWDECQQILEDIETLRTESRNLSNQERLKRAEQLRDDARNLNPTARAEQELENLRSSVKTEIQSEFGDLHYVSQFGEEYEIRNLQQFNEITLPNLDGATIQIGGSHHELSDTLSEGVHAHGLEATAHAIERANGHIEQMETHIEKGENEVVETFEDVDASLSTARELTERLDGEARERLTEYLFEGRSPSEDRIAPSKPDVDQYRERTKKELHRCDFEEARQQAKLALEEARRIEEIAEFFAESVVATIEYGSGSIPISDTVGSELVENLRIPFEQTYGVTYRVEDSTLHIAADDDSSPEEVTTATTQRQSTDGNDDPHADDVIYVLRELHENAAASSSEDTVELQTETLPEKFTKKEILERIKTFGERNPKVNEVTMDEDIPPGYLSVTVSDEVSPQRVIETLQKEYANTHRNG